MNKEWTSLDLYIKKVREYSGNNPFKTKAPQTGDIMELLEAMKAELLIYGYSQLMDTAYSTCCYFCANKHLSVQYYTSTHYYLTEPNQKKSISAFSAWWFLLLLPKYLLSEDISNIINSDTALYFFKNCAPKNPDFKDIVSALKNVDNAIIIQRKKMYYAFVSDITTSNKDVSCKSPKVAQDNSMIITKPDSSQLEDKTYHAKEFDSNTTEIEESEPIIKTESKEATIEKESMVNDACRQIEAERQAVINAAYKQIEVEKNAILDSAKKQAEEILSRAIAVADKRLAEAKKRVISLCAENQSDSYNAEQEDYQNYFSAVREALCTTNEAMKRLEDAVSEKYTKKIYTQLLELYNLIADTKDFSLEKSRKNNDIDLENTAYNMEVFLDMIVECLADFGIETIFSMQGEDFSGKYHEPILNDMDFDPRHTIIKKSLRNGFVWGEQVIQKEKVEI